MKNFEGKILRRKPKKIQKAGSPLNKLKILKNKRNIKKG